MRHHHSTEDGPLLGQQDFTGSTEEPKDKGTDKDIEEVAERVCQKIPEILVPTFARLAHRKLIIVFVIGKV